tara:strand:+ start:332 stop:1258 length:927 start_codon:yes stop_codon:yes gene_type:complete
VFRNTVNGSFIRHGASLTCAGAAALGLSSIINDVKTNQATNTLKDRPSLRDDIIQSSSDTPFAAFFFSSLVGSRLRFLAIDYMKDSTLRKSLPYGIASLNRHALFYLFEAGGCKLGEAYLSRYFGTFSNMSDSMNRGLSSLLAIGGITSCSVGFDVVLTRPSLLNNVTNFSLLGSSINNIFRVSYHPSVISASLGRNYLFTGFTLCSGSMLSSLPDTYRDSKGVQILAAIISGAFSTLPHHMFVNNVHRISEHQAPLRFTFNGSWKAMLCRGGYSGIILMGSMGFVNLSTFFNDKTMKDSPQYSANEK